MKSVALIAIAAMLCVLGGCKSHCPEKIDKYEITPGAHSAVTAVSRSRRGWIPRHQAVLDRNKQGEVDMIFVGDSITQGWERAGRSTWQQYYAKRNVVNLGFSGDRTQHVLWRLQNGEIAGISPKLAIILIGTNNSNGSDNTSREIGEGIIAICQKLRADLPDTKMLILAIFPRGETPSPQRQKNAEASSLAATVADNEWIYYLDIGDEFLGKNGRLPKELMPYYLHLNARAYQIWAEAIEPTVVKLMAEK